MGTFLQHFNAFYKECKVNKFIEKHKRLYESVCQNAKDTVKTSGILDKIQTFYGTSTNGRFVIYVDLLNNLGNNAIPTADDSFKNDRIFRLAYLSDVHKKLSDESPVLFSPHLNVVTHEISHLFLKGFIPEYYQDLYKIRDLFLTTSEGKKLDESGWENELDELLVRVCTACILAQKFGKDKGDEEIENQSRYFKLAKPLYDFFNTYISNRATYKEINDFYPEIVQFLKDYDK